MRSFIGRDGGSSSDGLIQEEVAQGNEREREHKSSPVRTDSATKLRTRRDGILLDTQEVISRQLHYPWPKSTLGFL
jgi:hypothetical protein